LTTKVAGKMRIAFLTTEFITESVFAGGLGNYLFRTALALKQKHGYSPIIFVRSEKDEHLVHHGIDVIRVQPHTPRWVKILDLLTLRKLTGVLAQISVSRTLWNKVLEEHRREKIDLVQATSYDATNICATKQIPSVVRISSFEPLWRKAYKKKLTLKQRLTEFLEVKAMKAACNVYAPSKVIAHAVQTAIHRPVAAIEPVFVNDSGPLDFGFFKKNLMGKKYLLFFGTIGAMKGCNEIAKILHPLLDKYRDLYFVFIGSVANEHSRTTKQHLLLCAGDFLERVLFFKPVKHDVLYSIIKESIAVVLPSRIDNFPNTCVEAMFLGQIVIGTDGTSFEELIDDGISGFLCRPCDPESLMQTIIKACSLTSEQRDIMSVNARKRIEQLSPDLALCELTDYYKMVIETWTKTENERCRASGILPGQRRRIA
jgi:glycogen synthase